MIVGFVGAADEVAHHGNGPVGDQRHVGRDPYRPQVAGGAAGGGRDLRVARPAKSVQSGEFSDFDFVQAVIAPKQEHVHLSVGMKHDAFDRAPERQME